MVVLRLPPLVMTLASLSVIQGVLLVYNAGKPVSGESDFLNYWALGTLLGCQRRSGCWPRISVLCLVLLHLTAYGRAIYAIGNNPRAALLSGVPIGVTQIATYALCSVFAAVTGC